MHMHLDSRGMQVHVFVIIVGSNLLLAFMREILAILRLDEATLHTRR